MDIHSIKVGFCNCYTIRDKGTILVDPGVPGNMVTNKNMVKNMVTQYLFPIFLFKENP